MTGRRRAATVVDVVVPRDLCMHCAIGTRGGARAGSLEAQTRSLQDAQLATHGDGEGAPSHNTVLWPWAVSARSACRPSQLPYTRVETAGSRSSGKLASAHMPCHRQGLSAMPQARRRVSSGGSCARGALGRRRGTGGGARLTAHTQQTASVGRAQPQAVGITKKGSCAGGVLADCLGAGRGAVRRCNLGR